MPRVENTSAWAEEVVDRVMRLRQGLGRSVSVGISGVDCAGKTTLAEAVHILLQSRGVCSVLISGDEFTRPTSDRYENADEGLGYYLDSFNYAQLFEDILPAVRDNVAGEMIVQVADWERDSWRDHVVALAADGTVIVEGCFLFADQRAAEFDLSV
jgi:uridine kinase